MSKIERKIDKLDNAFLFLLSFIGLVITIVQVYIVGISGLLESLPLLFIGIAIPFYIGYLRGAVSMELINHSLVERMRGWVYLIIGVSAYTGYVISIRVSFKILFWFDVPFIFCIAIGGVFTYLLLKWVINVFRQEIGNNISYEYAFSGTIVSAFLLPFFLRMLVSMYMDLQPRFQYSSLLMFFVWITLTMTWVSFVYEKVSRNIINSNLRLNATEIEKRRQRWVFSRFFVYISEIYYFTFQASLRSTFLWGEGMLIGLLGSLLFVLRIPIFSDAYLMTSAFLLFLGTVYFMKLRIDFSILVPLGRLRKRTQR